MKISFETNYQNKKTPINFGAYRPALDKHGNREHNFYVAYDPSVYDATLEFFEAKQENHVWNANLSNPVVSVPMQAGGISIKDDVIKDSIYPHLAYRYKLINKNNPSDVRYVLDNGTKTGEEKQYKSENNNFVSDGTWNSKNATILYTDRTISSRPLNAMLIMPDMFHQRRKQLVGNEIVGIPQNTLKNHVNSLGGNFAGIEEKLDELQKAGITKIVGTPFTKDDITSHKYATQNAYQIASSFGTFEEYTKLQEKMFEKGIGWIADAAFVNEGLTGIHFTNLMKWGNQSPFANWFYLSNPNEPITLGIFPKRNQENVGFKLVNSRFHISQDEKTKQIKLSENFNYEADKPTYVQFFDKTLIEPTEGNSSSYFIENYQKTSINDGFKLTNGEDTMPIYTFQIDTKKLKANIDRVNENLKKHPKDLQRNLEDIELIKQLFAFENFNFDVNTEGVACWEGNKELPKLNLHVSRTDTEAAINSDTTITQQMRKNDDGTYSVDINSPQYQREIGRLHVMDYSARAAKYWTAETRDIQIRHAATLLGKSDDYYTKMQELVKEGKLHPDILTLVDKEVIENVKSGNYNLQMSPMGEKKVLVKEAMDKLPFESLNFSDEVIAVFSSPYITKRPFAENEFNLTREDIADNDYKNIPTEYRDVYKKFDKLLNGKILNYVIDVLDTANKDLDFPLYKENTNEIILEPHAAEIVKLLIPQLTKKVMEYSLANLAIDTHPDANISLERLAQEKENVSLTNLGIDAISPKQEASLLVDKIEKGFDKLMDNSNSSTCIRDGLAIEIGKFIGSTNYEGIKLAKVIQEKMETGLGFRIDATKDVSNNDEAREGIGRADDLIHNVKSVWERVVSSIREEYKNSYITAELTDLNVYTDKYEDLKGNPQKSTIEQQRYNQESKAELALLEDASMTSFANYKYFYSAIQNMFQSSSETGASAQESISDLKNKFTSAWDGTRNILDHGPYDAIKGAYNFYENHDKPRALHVFALDMGLFQGSFVNGNDTEKHQNIARALFSHMDKNLTGEDYNTINPKAVAMGDRLNKALKTLFNKDNSSNLDKEKLSEEQFIAKLSDEDKSFVQAFRKANAQLAYGMYKGETYNAEAYGVRPFEIVLQQVFEQMKYNGYQIDDKTIDSKKMALLSEILGPASEDAYKVYRIMSTLPGMLTEFAGHRQGSSGYESLSNNLYVANRNRINWEFTEKIPAIKAFDEKMQAVTNMRFKPELSALVDGDTIVLPKDTNAIQPLSKEQEKKGEKPNDVLGLFRYNDRGSKVISLITPKKEDFVFMNKKILLNNDIEGIIGGLKEGTKFQAEDPTGEDKSVYIVRKYTDTGHHYLSRYANENDYLTAKTEAEKDAKSQDIKIATAAGCILVLKCLEGIKNQTKQLSGTIKGFDYFSTAKAVVKRTLNTIV
ncbi:hypothetical protein J6Q66_05770 [bacterium]|nr:hypothetical protein [bacterium]